MILYHGSNVQIDAIELRRCNRFKVEDITAELIKYLVEYEQYEIPAAISAIYSSELYRALSRPETGLYIKSTGYIRDYLMRELKMGKLA